MKKIQGKKVTEKHFTISKLILYFVFLIWSFWNDFHFFDFTHEDRISYYISSGNPNSVAFYITVKIIFIGLTYAFFTYWFQTAYKCFNHDELAIEKAKTILKIFIVYMFVLLLIYPGIWKHPNGADEFQLVSFSQRLQVQYHQGVVSAIMFILSFMCFPKPVMVVITQMIIGAMILGDTAFDIKRKSKKAYVLFMVLVFSPASLYYVLYPLRIYLFSVLVVSFLHYLLKMPEGKDIRKADLIGMTIVTCILINTRIEIMFLILLYPLLLLKSCKKKIICYIELIVICSVLAGSMLNNLGYQACTKSHNSLMLCGPLCVFLSDDSIDKTEYKEDIANIDKVLDVERMIERGDYRYGLGERLDTYSNEEYTKYLISATRIMLKNPHIYIKAKFLTALDGLGLSKNMGNIEYAFPVEVKPERIQKYFQNINIDRHDKFACIIGGDFSINKLNMYYLFYAFWLPTILVIITLLFNIKSNKVLCTACVVLTLQFLLTAATEPSSDRMYFFVEYLAGWYLVIWSFADKRAKTSARHLPCMKKEQKN